jgi:imidazoleglycerol-phosphate dehydratase
MPRTATISRKTNETEISLSLNLDGTGAGDIQTGVGFLDHMLDHLARHGLMDLTVTASGDLHIDDHHTVEDIAICLGEALEKALGDKAGICRYGHARVPMDETLADVTLDLSGRAHVVWDVTFATGKIGAMDSQLIEEFIIRFATVAKMNLHVSVPHGRNDHHIAEAIFKALARALRAAMELDPRRGTQIPSTKGVI